MMDLHQELADMMVDVSEQRERRMVVFIVTLAALACSQFASAGQHPTVAAALVLFSIITSFAAIIMTVMLWIRMRSMVVIADEIMKESEKEQDDASDN